jgi:hypothetical protein
MTQYLLTVFQPDGPPPEQAELDEIMRDVNAVDQEMRDAGVWVFAGGLHDPSSATVVRHQDGEFLITDGPYAEGKEHVGGFSIIKAGDLDEALQWARKLARAARLPIEVRPFQDV